MFRTNSFPPRSPVFRRNHQQVKCPGRQVCCYPQALHGVGDVVCSLVSFLGSLRVNQRLARGCKSSRTNVRFACLQKVHVLSLRSPDKVRSIEQLLVRHFFLCNVAVDFPLKIPNIEHTHDITYKQNHVQTNPHVCLQCFFGLVCAESSRPILAARAPLTYRGRFLSMDLEIFGVTLADRICRANVMQSRYLVCRIQLARVNPDMCVYAACQ